MKCPSCAAAELVNGSRDMPYTYKGKTITMANVVGGYCPACGEMVLDAGESARVSGVMLDFNKQVNGAIADQQKSYRHPEISPLQFPSCQGVMACYTWAIWYVCASQAYQMWHCPISCWRQV